MKEDFTDYLLDKPKITPEVLSYYEKHPEEIELITDREEIQMGIIRSFFVLALILVAGAKVLTYFFKGKTPNFWIDVVLEVVFEVGNAIMGGVLAAFIMERLQKKQYEKNVRYKREVLRLLKERAAN